MDGSRWGVSAPIGAGVPSVVEYCQSRDNPETWRWHERCQRRLGETPTNRRPRN